MNVVLEMRLSSIIKPEGGMQHGKLQPKQFRIGRVINNGNQGLVIQRP